jgi:hypothetical protein
MEGRCRALGSDLKNFAVEMLGSYLTWDEAWVPAPVLVVFAGLCGICTGFFKPDGADHSKA